MPESFKQQTVRRIHALDYRFILPLLSKLPLKLSYPLASLRGRFNAKTGMDWRSVAFGTDLKGDCAIAYRQLCPDASEQEIMALTQQRFRSQAREEFEAHLVIGGRTDELSCTFSTSEGLAAYGDQQKGLVLLTPHFDSFFLGVGLLGRLGRKFNAMSSAVTNDSRVIPAVQRYYQRKYRGIETLMNGGTVLDMEQGLKSFYTMLRRREVLLVLADLPPVSQGAGLQTTFLGCKRQLAGGALRLAQHTNSTIGSYVCQYQGGRQYHITFGPFGSPDDGKAVASIYQFFSERIMADPGRWWGADLLNVLHPVQAK